MFVRELFGGSNECIVECMFLDRERGPMCGQGGFVTARCRPGQRGCSVVVDHIFETSPSEIEKGLRRDSDAGGQTLDLSQQRNQMVGADRGGCVIQRSPVIGNSEPATAEQIDKYRSDRIIVDRELAMRHQPLSPDCGGRQRHQRMDRTMPNMTRNRD